MAYRPYPNRRSDPHAYEPQIHRAAEVHQPEPPLTMRLDPRALALYDDIGTQVVATANALCEASRQTRGRT